MTAAVEPFSIKVSSDVLDDLRSRLEEHALARGRGVRRLEPGHSPEMD